MKYPGEFINKRLFEISCMPEWKTHRQRCSIRYVVDSTGFEDRSYTNVNAHELAISGLGI
jgi:hypothetical protein